MTDHFEIPQEILDTAPRMELSRRAIIKGLAAGTMFPIVAGCATTAQTDAQLAQLSASAWADLKAQTPVSRDSRLVGPVMETWNQLVAGTPKANEAWDVQVFDSQSVNAFVMPGNRVGIYRGIVDLTENMDQLSSVLGHEVGHSVNFHAAKRAQRAQFANIGLIAGQIALGTAASTGRVSGANAQVLSQLGGAAVQFGVILPFSRSHELEADKLGVDYMHASGFSVKEAPRLWELMAAQSEGQRPAEFMSTHPDPLRRADELRNYINSQGYDVV